MNNNNPNTPGLIYELRRRKVFRTSIWYALACWLLLLTLDVKGASWGLPEWTEMVVLMAVVLGFPIVLGLAWAFDITPHGVQRAEPRSPAENGN